MTEKVSNRIVSIAVAFILLLALAAVLGGSHSVYAANMALDEAIAIESGTVDITFRTNTDESWECKKWYSFTPGETDWYYVELSNPIYIDSEYDTTLYFYPSYYDARDNENYTSYDLQESHRRISFKSKLNAGQTYYIKIIVTSGYEQNTDYNMTLGVQKTDPPPARVKFKDSEVTYTLGGSGYEELELERAGAKRWTSSNDEVVGILDGGYSSYAYLELKKPGSAVITAYDKDGLSDSCTVFVVTPAIVVPDKELTFNVTEEDVSFNITSGYDLTYESSDKSVVKINSDSNDGRCCLDLVAPGTATVTINDPAGKEETVSITVKEAIWSLEKQKIDAYISNDDIKLNIITEQENNSFKGTSSNSNVVSVDNDYYGDKCIRLGFEGVGTAVITVVDSYGKSATCTVTVKPDPLKLNRTSFKYDSLNDYEEVEKDCFYAKGDYNDIASVSSSNTKVVKVTKVKDDNDKYVAEIKPVGEGTAVITITDQYGQTATASVTVTQKFIDESKYLEDLSDSWVAGSEEYLLYGDTTIYCSCDIACSVYTIINNKKYTGSVDSDGYCVIRGIPILPAGTKLTVVFQKGQAIYSTTETIQKRGADYLSVKTTAQVYTGKALKPAVTVKYKKTVLKAGTDYSVRYSNNKKVGKGKATITFKGNYKGAKAAYFNINPKPTTLIKVLPAKRGFTAKWKKKVAQTTGYQLQYSRNKNFSYSNKTVTISKNKTVFKKVLKLKAKKKYYVRVRTYKTVGDKQYYSAWSDAKAVTTKK